MVIAAPEELEVAAAPVPVAGLSPTELFAVFRRLAPAGRKCRLDAAGLHDYKDTISWSQVLLRPPTVPFAVPLASRRTGVFSLLCFDLDVTGAGLGPEGVAEDLERLVEWLDEADARYLVAQSSPVGGQHVWLAVPAGVDAESVAELGRALSALLPTLDAGMLANPRTGCARPPGAAHRRGGRSVVDAHVHPDQHEALAGFAAGNGADVVERLLAVLPAEARASAAPGKAVARPLGIDGDGRPQLARERRELSPRVAGLAIQAPESGENASARLWSIALGAAFAGWSYSDFAALCRSAPGAVHAHAARVAPGAIERRERSETEREALLERQWTRAVERASAMPTSAVPAGEDEEAAWEARRQEVVRVVWAVLDRMEAEPWRWATKAGPVDEQALRGLLVRALEAVTLEVGASCRSLALQVGVCATSVSEALRRLATPSLLDGDAWIAQEEASQGTRSAVWRLLAPTDQAEYLPVDITRTQYSHPPTARAERARFAALEGSLDLARHDLWHPQYGIGHGPGRTYTAIRTKKVPRKRLTVPALADLTGYSPTTVLHHLQRLALHGLVVLGKLRSGTRTVRATDRSLDAAAAQLGAAGAGDARIVRYAIDREVFRWWNDEQTWRSAPAVTKPIGAPTTEALDPDFVPAGWAERDRRWAYGRFPVTESGRADWAAARSIVKARQ